jgi:hypothetical protein
MNWKAAATIVFGLILAACAPEKEVPSSPPEPIEAVLDVPKGADVGKEVIISTTVTQDGKPVDHADEVKYEIWKDGYKETSEMLDAVSKNDGVYTVSKTFNEKAVYHIQVHVTARGLHTMPKSSLSVGNAIPSDLKEEVHHEQE